MIKVEHIAIWTKDIETLRLFYETYFKARSSQKYKNQKTLFCSYFLNFESGARLEIMQMPSIPLSENNPYKQFTGIIHLAISLGSQEKVDLLTCQLKQDGYEILDGPRKTGDGYYESVVLDPDNNRIEITI